MNRYFVALLTILLLAVPVSVSAGSDFSFGFVGGSYGSAVSVGFTSVNVDRGYGYGAPVYANTQYVSHQTTVVWGDGYRCRTPIHYRPVSYRPANWYAHSRGAVVRERYVSRRVHHYGGRW